MATSSSAESSGASSASAPTTTSCGFRGCLRVAVASLLTEAGFEAAAPLAVESLCEMAQSFVVEVGRSSRAYADVACRAEVLPADVVLALSEMGLRTSTLSEHAYRTTRRGLSAPPTVQPVKATPILRTGDSVSRPPGGGIFPENCPDFPDSHTYLRTPTHKQPVTDYVSVREKTASQKRDVERALTRFIAKTGRTHSLFNTDDTNLFPLISCDRVLPDQPLLPPYINALLFKDQVFEEDEMEFLPKKKPAKEEKADDGAKKLPSTPESLRHDGIDNPYLRPVKMPRTPAIRRLL